VSISYINQLVKARAARATFGACILAPYNESRHRERRHKAFFHYEYVTESAILRAAHLVRNTVTVR
jgi:hypothetical protein